MQYVTRAWILFFIVAPGSQADTLRLPDGRTIVGQWMGGTPRVIQFDVGGRIQQFSPTEVESIIFDTDSGYAPARGAAPEVGSSTLSPRKPVTEPTGQFSNAPTPAPNFANSPPAPAREPASRNSVTGIWEGMAIFGPRSQFHARVEITQNGEKIYGREWLNDFSGQQAAIMTLTGDVARDQINIRLNLLGNRPGTAWCLTPRDLTLSADGGSMSGRSSGTSRCLVPELTLTRNSVKTTQWAVCSDRSIKDVMVNLANDEDKDPEVLKQKALAAVFFGLNVKQTMTQVARVTLIDGALVPGTFTCVANLSMNPGVSDSNLSPGAVYDDDFERQFIKGAANGMMMAAGATRYFVMRALNEGNYEVTLYSPEKRTYPYKKVVRVSQ